MANPACQIFVMAKTRTARFLIALIAPRLNTVDPQCSALAPLDPGACVKLAKSNMAVVVVAERATDRATEIIRLDAEGAPHWLIG